MMWGTQPAFLSSAAVNGYFDTATFGDTGGQLWVLRFGAVYPVYRVGYRDVLATVEGHLGEYDNLEICGRQGAFWYGNTAQGMRQALDLVRNLGIAESVAA